MSHFTERLPTWLRRGLSIGVLLAVIALVQYFVGWQRVAAAWLAAGPVPIAGCFALLVGSYAARATRIGLALAPRPPFLTLLRVTTIHLAAINTLPARAGEFALPWLLARECGRRFGDGIALLFWIRLLDVQVLGMLAAAIVLAPTGQAPAAVGAIAALVGPVAVWAALQRPGWVRIGTQGRLGRLFHTVRDHAPPGLVAYLHLGAWTLAAWLLKFAALGAWLTALTGMEPGTALLAVVAAEVAALIPVQGPAAAGTYEAAVTATLVAAGIPAAAALSAAVSLHLFVLGSSLLCGGISWVVRPARRPAGADTEG